MRKIEDHWYRSSLSVLTICLLPLSWLFRAAVSVRYVLYRYQIKKSVSLPVPVIVVGNLTVGGTGKTPFVMWLVQLLQKAGYQPGIVTRGTGGQKQSSPYWVDADADPALIGDESVLLARRTECPVVVCVDRVAAAQQLLAKTSCDVIISDDGLQHYRLRRDIEIAMIDGERQLGNRQLLPAGPLREPPSRLQRVDHIVIQGDAEGEAFSMKLCGDLLFCVHHLTEKKPLHDFRDQTVHAVAGVGNPKRFFSALREAGLNVIEHIFPDHYLYQKDDIYFSDDLPVMMTEKDAVKCIEWADDRHWYLPVQAQVSGDLGEQIVKKLEELCKR